MSTTEAGGGEILEKEEISELIRYMRQRHIEIVPEVQSLSHAYWMLAAHKECAERGDDPYPDAYCPSNPATYEIYFDCLREVVDLFQPRTVHIGHDEYYSIGLCDRCKSRSGHEILAEDINKLHAWLARRGIRTILWGDKLFNTSFIADTEGGREIRYPNRINGREEIIKATYRAVDMIPQDITVMDWYHTLHGKDTETQKYFHQKGMNVIFGNFDAHRWERYGIPNLEERLRWPNVLGGANSLWHEVSDLGMKAQDALVSLLENAQFLWYEGYKVRMRYELNRVISQLYPLERDRLNDTASIALACREFETIDISAKYNAPLLREPNCLFIRDAEPVAGTIPFKVCCGAGDPASHPAYLFVGGAYPAVVDGIRISGTLRGLAFLHAYSEYLGHIPLHAYSYFNFAEKFGVGKYIVRYKDGTAAEVPIEFGDNLSYIHNEFEAYHADPVYQTVSFDQRLLRDDSPDALLKAATPSTVYCSEWANPAPHKEVAGISIRHNSSQKGGLLIFAITAMR